MTWDADASLLAFKIAGGFLLIACGYCLDLWLRSRKAKMQRKSSEKYWAAVREFENANSGGAAVRCPVQDVGP